MAPSLPDLATYQWSSTDETKRCPVFNPATGKKLTTVQCGDDATTERAIAASKAAFDNHWSQTTASERSILLFACAAALESHADELATLLCLENGKPRQDALAFDIKFIVGVFRYFASLVDKLPTQFMDRGSVYVSVVREPHGVCAGILPFNWPPIHTGGKAAPALAAGNTIILKPGEQAPLTCLRIVDILQGVLPKDVLMAVPGLGPEVPQVLLTNKTVKMVSFTGSTPAGVAVSKTAAETMKPLALELGGKNAFIVFDDANTERAARDAIDGGYFNKGEACTAASKLVVQEGIHDRFVEMLTRAVKRLRAGNGMDDKTHVGPCVTQAQQHKVLQYIEIGKKEGATVAAQAPLPTASECKNGFFVPPTLITGVNRGDTLDKEEIFGPVLTVTKFSTEDEAVEIANGTRFGLTAIVFTENNERGLRVCRRLESGMVWLNNYRRQLLGVPFGGVKDSGHGREHWTDTLNEWSTPKFIQMPSGRGELGSWRGAPDVFGPEEQVNGHG